MRIGPTTLRSNERDYKVWKIIRFRNIQVEVNWRQACRGSNPHTWAKWSCSPTGRGNRFKTYSVTVRIRLGLQINIIGELTQAALGTVLKTAGTVKGMGIDTSALRILYWVYTL